MKLFFAFAFLVAYSYGSLTCFPSPRFDWLTSNLTLDEPWSEYSDPNNKCCNDIDPETTIDFDAKCSLCYRHTDSTPGFMLDPNNCQKFFMCVPDPSKEGSFLAHSMTCPDCMFWDDVKLSCVEVDTSCRVSVSVPTGTPNPAVTHDPLISCINFEEESLSTNGMYVLNKGVQVIENGVDGVPNDFCPEGNRCGFFNQSQLEIPMFSNGLSQLPNLRVSFDMLYTQAFQYYEAILGNDCFNNVHGLEGNSYGFAIWNDITNLQFADTNNVNYNLLNSLDRGVWGHVDINYNGTHLITISNGEQTVLKLPESFSGIRDSHCPMLIGSLIYQSAYTFFNGYIDNMCFYVTYED